MGTPLFRPRRNVNPKSGLTNRPQSGSISRLVSNQYHAWRSKLKGDDWYEQSSFNSKPKSK